MARSRSPRRRSRRRSPRRASRSRRRSPCPRGQIMRSGYRRKAYTRADGTRVRSARVRRDCIKGRGLHPSRKGPRVIPKLKKGLLEKYGYHGREPVAKRHTALRKAERAYGSTNLIRKLNAIYVLNRNTSPSLAAKFKADENWVRRTFGEDAGGRRRSRRRSPRKRSRRRSRSRNGRRRRSRSRNGRRRRSRRRSPRKRRSRRSRSRNGRRRRSRFSFNGNGMSDQERKARACRDKGLIYDTDTEECRRSRRR